MNRKYELREDKACGPDEIGLETFRQCAEEAAKHTI